MQIIYQFLILLVSLLVLAKSASLVVQNLVKIANILRWSTFVVSFIALGMASSTPEFFVGINSAIAKTPQLSLGNTMGASIVLLTLLTGLASLISGKVIVDATFANKDLIIMNLVVLLPIFLLYDGALERLDSIVMFLAYVVYVYRIYKERHKLSHPLTRINNDHTLEKSITYLVLGFIGLAVASNYAVGSAKMIAEFLQIPVLLIGILVFSLGTNLPEFTIAMAAVRKKQKAIVLGNVLGSASTNTLVIALASFLQPFEVSDLETFIVSVFFLVVAVFIFSSFVKSKNEISRIEGFFLLSLYFLFVITEIVTKLI